MTQSTHSITSIWKFIFGHEKSTESVPLVESVESARLFETSTKSDPDTGIKITKGIEGNNFFAPRAISILRNSYKLKPKTTPDEIKRIADIIGDTKERVSRWFCKNRFKDKKLVNKSSIRNNHYNPEVKKYLNSSFEENHSPNSNEISRIANVVGLSDKQVKKWFVNARFFRRRRFTEREEEIILETLGKRRYLRLHERDELAKRFNINVKYIEFWLTNRRKNRMMI